MSAASPPRSPSASRAARPATISPTAISERFAGRSPGRILLYRDFQEAVAAGIETIGWGAGDPGYKTEMGAEPGPEILDLLIVRGAVRAALARPFWERRR